jgi:hypothetical protein
MAGHDVNIQDVRVDPYGPGQDIVDRALAGLPNHPSLRPLLQGAEYQVLSFRLVGPERKTSALPPPPDQVLATVVDYTNHRTLVVEGRLEDLDPDIYGDVQVIQVSDQPLPSKEEVEAAVEIVRQDREIAEQVEQDRAVLYQPMPPLIAAELPDGSMKRIVAVGVLSEQGERHRFFGVDLGTGNILREPSGMAEHDGERCEPPPAVDACASTGTIGQVRVQVLQEGRILWSFLATRPAASTGTTGSGIELANVTYRGKQVLFRAHVPILNVEYFEDGIANGCGPTFRDWQNSEACFEANGTDVIPGIRLCSTPAQTILDTGSDGGDFRGVAIYVQGQEVVLVSEMQAGWYRYISEWRFHTDGTIRPRFGFAATDNPCTCRAHHHHVYWRFDLDIRTSGGNLVEEFNDPPLGGTSSWHSKTFETRRVRDLGSGRHWRISNVRTSDSYLLVPGPNDGSASAYGVGDVWILRYKTPPPSQQGPEIDDGVGFTTDPALSRANLDAFRTPGEYLANVDPLTGQPRGADVVIWYAAHFLHDQAHPGGDRLGPDLRPSQW